MKLEIGYNQEFEVRREIVESSIQNNLSVMFISDLHLTKLGHSLIENIIKKINELKPTIILLGGDYIETCSGLVHFNTLLKTLGQREYVFAIAGNHDYFYGIHLIRKIMLDNNITWIEKSSVNIKINDVLIKIDGNCISKKRDENDLTILCLHKPLNIEELGNCYDVVFAGHLHGCQIVFWKNNEDLYPGKIFYKNNFLKKDFGNSKYFISKGLGELKEPYAG